MATAEFEGPHWTAGKAGVARPEQYEKRSERIPRIIASPFVGAARLLAGLFMLAFWTGIIGPIWIFKILRSIALFSIKASYYQFSGRAPPHISELDAVAQMWVFGFGDILRILFGKSQPGAPPAPLTLLQLIQETLVGVFFYASLITWAYLVWKYEFGLLILFRGLF